MIKKLLLLPILLLFLSSQEQTIWQLELTARDIQAGPTMNFDNEWVSPVMIKIRNILKNYRTVGCSFDQNFKDSGYVRIFVHLTDSTIESRKFYIYHIDKGYFNSLSLHTYFGPEDIEHYCFRNYTANDYYLDTEKLKFRPNYYKKHPESVITYIYLIGTYEQ